MTIQLEDILNDLHEDHRNMAVMLDLLARETEHIRDGEKPDYELIHDIMRYMTTYSDAVHHPKEDIIYSRLREEREDLADGLDDVSHDHELIATLGGRLRDDVEAVIAGAALRRDKFIEDATRYVNHLRTHGLPHRGSRPEH